MSTGDSQGETVRPPGRRPGIASNPTLDPSFQNTSKETVNAPHSGPSDSRRWQTEMFVPETSPSKSFKRKKPKSNNQTPPPVSQVVALTDTTSIGIKMNPNTNSSLNPPPFEEKSIPKSPILPSSPTTPTNNTNSTPSVTWQTQMFVPEPNVVGERNNHSIETESTKKQERRTLQTLEERRERKVQQTRNEINNQTSETASPLQKSQVHDLPKTFKPKTPFTNAQPIVPPPFLSTTHVNNTPFKSYNLTDLAQEKLNALLGSESKHPVKQNSLTHLVVPIHSTRRGGTDKARSTGSVTADLQDFRKQSSLPLITPDGKWPQSSSANVVPFMNSTLSTKQSFDTAPFVAQLQSTTSSTKEITKPRMPTQGSKSILRDPSSKRYQADDKQSSHIAWTSKVFIVEGSTTSEEGTESSRESLESKEKKSQENRRRSLAALSTTKSMRIDNKETRDVRWNWNQLLISKTFTPYRKMLAKGDDLLPDNDDFNIFENCEGATENKYDSVRDTMLENGELTEREIACFFEGFSLFTVKVRSLESQLDSMKAANRSTSKRDMFAARSIRGVSRMVSQSVGNDIGGRFGSIKRAESGKREALLTAHKSSSSSSEEAQGGMSISALPIPFAQKYSSQKSLRAMSIRKVQTDHKGDEKIQRLLDELQEAEKKQKKLEKQLQQAGITIAEDIPFEEAKAEVVRIAMRMEEIGSADVKHEDKIQQAKLREEYFKLEQDMEKYNTALTLTDEWIEVQEEQEQKWEEDNAPENEEALKQLRRHMPVDVKSLSEAQLSSDLTPNGKVLPVVIAKKFKRTNVLQLIRTNPDDLVRVHPSTLENLRVASLTLTERRAIYAHVRSIGPRWKAMQADQMTERKWNWYQTMKLNFKENLDSYLHHVARYGPPGNHPYATRENPNDGCPLIGKQCPLRADKLIDYDNDYGYTDEPQYEVSNVRKADTEDPGAKAIREASEFAREKKAGLRSDLLKKHYKGKVLQVSLANGSCESMDNTLDKVNSWQTKWIEERFADGFVISDATTRKEMGAFFEALNELKLNVLQLAERSGMQLTGKKDANADQPDIRSPVELGLSEEVYESADDFFDGLVERMEELKVKDGRLKLTIEQLRDLLVELHERNVATLKASGVDRPEPSRQRKNRKEIEKDAKATLKPEEVEVVSPSAGRHVGGPGRGGLMDAIAGRGGGPGRGGLMDAIAGRGRGGGPGRGGLMDAIAGRGRGGGPGRGGFLDAIAGRGRESRDTGRGGLMAATAGRGRGGRDAGRGGLMDAIAARGSGQGGLSGKGRPVDDITARSADRSNARDSGSEDLMAAIKAGGITRESGVDAAPHTCEVSLTSERSAQGRGGEGQGNTRDAGRGDFLAMIHAKGRGRGHFGSERAITSQGTIEQIPPTIFNSPVGHIGTEDDSAERISLLAEWNEHQDSQKSGVVSEIKEGIHSIRPPPSHIPTLATKDRNERAAPAGMTGLMAELQARKAAPADA
jgi:hypothetical protein